MQYTIRDIPPHLDVELRERARREKKSLDRVAQFRTQGTPIPVHDLWIAEPVLQHDLLVHSRDRHFRHLPRIVRV